MYASNEETLEASLLGFTIFVYNVYLLDNVI